MLFASLIAVALKDRNKPVITALDLHLLIQEIHTAGAWNGEPIQRRPKAWDHRHFNTMLQRLVRREVLAADHDFAYGVFRVLEVDGAGTAEQIACLVDPFCYVAYGSAFTLNGLRGAPASPLRLETLEAKLWAARWSQRLEALSPDEYGRRPSYPRSHTREKLRRRAVTMRGTSAPAPVTQIGDVRVSTLGATFAASLAEPALCGGMTTVLKLWRRYAPAHVDEIVQAVEASTAKIVKVRAGYIFTELLGLQTPPILGWLAFAQRGGSRKLDPERPYAPVFSERWMLSLNLEA